MSSLFYLGCAYIIGGVTFFPILLLLLALHAYLILPSTSLTIPYSAPCPLKDSADDGENIRPGEVEDIKTQREPEKEFGGYFAVSREWVPGGINGKPPERTTPAGEIILEESPSVYQSMYRSLFDRKQTPTMETMKANGKPAKRPRNVFYIVLRHGHLMLFDDSEQLEVRHVVSLAHHDVSIYAGVEEIPEGELWIKRNAICLTRKATTREQQGPISKPFYLFSENCSEKEDFYFAILQNQERHSSERHPLPLVQQFETKHIVGLVQSLHSSEEQLQTRWFNALIGRLFLGVYKTQEIEDFIRMKIIKKISRVNKPTFLSGIALKKINLGDSAPFITNPRLKDLTIEGDCCVEADVRYSGGFRIEVGTTAKIELGTRFKTREVDLVLAITLKKLEGHLLVRFKPPPSNRMWIAFEQMPQLSMQIEPIVSSRQITYGIILRAIESRIREVIAETLVLPHWDDSPFLDTTYSMFRGGIWANERHDFHIPTETVVPDMELEMKGEEAETPVTPLSTYSQLSGDISLSTPSLLNNQAPGLSARKLKNPIRSSAETGVIVSSSGIQKTSDVARGIRSKSFASAAVPIVNTDTISSPTKPDTRQAKDAASFMAELSNRSHPGSPPNTPAGSYESSGSSFAGRDRPGSVPSNSSHNSDSELSSSQITLTNAAGDTNVPQAPGVLDYRTLDPTTEPMSKESRPQYAARRSIPLERKQQSLAAAAIAAKNWSWKALSRGKGAGSPAVPERLGTLEHPIGRGRPLPPPGQPLPPPEKSSPASPITIHSKRNFVSAYNASEPVREPPKSRIFSLATSRPSGLEELPTHTQGDGILVVEAPADSVPSSPAVDDHFGEYMDNFNKDDDLEDDLEDAAHNLNSESQDSMSGSEPSASYWTKDLFSASVPGRRGNSYSPVYDDDGHGLTSWKAAQEEAARSKSIWMDEHEQA